MEINDLLKLRTNEKKDCKVSANGIIWLRKGEYSQRIKQNGTNRKENDRRVENRDNVLGDMVQSLQKNEPEYIAKFNPVQKYNKTEDRKQGKNRNKLYSVNKRKVRARLINFNNTDYGDKKLYFYSISFPVGFCEKLSTRLLNSVITSLRKDHQVVHYLWVAERQKKGAKHYHLCLFHYVKGRVVNDLVKKYIKHAIRKKQLNWSIGAASKYNGVDISKDRITKVPTNFALAQQQRNITRYVTKYISKSSGSFEGQAWNSSRSLACISDGICATIEEVLSIYSNEVLNDNAAYENEWCYFFRWKKEAPPDIVNALRAINNIKVKECMLAASQLGIKA